MKVWTFYRLRTGLEPQLYAYTDQKKYADEFNTFRKNFYLKVHDMRKSEFKQICSDHPDQKIDFHKFSTRNKKFMTPKLTEPIICTSGEIKQIILYKNDLALRMLARVVCQLDYTIFSKNIQSNLRILGYNSIEDYIRYVNFDFNNFTDSFDTIASGFEVDELGLYILIHENTLRDL